MSGIHSHHVGRQLTTLRQRVPRYTPWLYAITSTLVCGAALYYAVPAHAQILTDKISTSEINATTTKTLSERQAIAMALTRPALIAVNQSQVALAESHVQAAGLLSNPTLSYGRARVDVLGDRRTEASISVSQTIDISGRRSLRKEAAEQLAIASREDGRHYRATVVNDVRRVFADNLYRVEIIKSLSAWTTRLEHIHQNVQKMAKAGEVSGYDGRRLSRELQTGQARLTSAETDAMRAKMRLIGLVGLVDLTGASNTNEQYQTASSTSLVEVSGTLLPEVSQNLLFYQTALQGRPDLAALKAQAESFKRDQQIAARSWVPEVNVGLGQKRLEETGRSNTGVMLSLSIPIALFDRGQASGAKANAQLASSQAQSHLLLREAQSEVHGSWMQTTTMRETADKFRRETLADTQALSRIAEKAYQAGEGSIVELLDAYRAQLDAELMGLELEWRARLAGIELDYLAGVSNHE